MTVTETTNYKLKKPDRAEIVRVGDINYNTDAIDKGLENRSRSGTTTPTFDATRDHINDRFYNTTEKKEYYCTGTAWVKMESGKEYSAGDGIAISDTNVISVDNTIATKTDLNSKVNVSSDKVIKEISKTIGTDKITLKSDRRSLELNTTTDSLNLDIPAADTTNDKAGLYTKAINDGIATLISDETTRATDAENTIANNLSSEITRAKNKENEIAGNLTSEVTRATDAENTIATNLTNEITRATNAEDALDSRLDDVEAGYLVKVETENTTSTGKDGKIKFTASPATGSKDIVLFTGLTLDTNGIGVNEATTIRDATNAKNNIFPSELATRTELDKKEDLTNKKNTVSTQSEYSSTNYYPSLLFLTNHIIRKGIYNATTGIQGDIVDDLLGGGIEAEGRSNRALSAYQGKILADMIADISTIGRYLSSWNAVDGTAGSDPPGYPEKPYKFKSGDYYIVSMAAAAGSAKAPKDNNGYYEAGLYQTITHAVNLNDVFRYDGANWIYSAQQANDVYFYGIQGNPRDNSKLNIELNLKSSGIKLSDGSATYTPDPASGYYTVLGVGNVVNKLVKLGGVIGKNEGIKWDGSIFTSAKFEYSTNKVSAFQYTPDNDHYPSEKLVKTKLDEKLNLSGGVMSGSINMSSNPITNLATPSSDMDAVTKKYVDDNYLAVGDTPALSSMLGTNGDTGFVLSPEYKKLNNTHDTITSANITIPLVSTSANGLMLKADKTKLDRMIFITDAEINTLIEAWAA